MRLIVVLLFLLCSSSVVATSSEFFSKSKEGWFYYQDPDKSIDNNKTQEDAKFISSLPLDNLSHMSAEDFRKSMDKVRDIAIMKPTQENIMAWKRMVKFSTDQSKLFTVNYKIASIIDDSYEYNDIGTGGFTQNALKDAQKQKEKAKYLTENIAFVTFVKDGNSKLAQKQIMVNMELKRDFRVDSRTFATEEYPDIVDELGIIGDIENFIYYKDKKEWQRIRRGLIDANTFVNDFMFFEEHKNTFKEKENE